MILFGCRGSSFEHVGARAHGDAVLSRCSHESGGVCFIVVHVLTRMNLLRSWDDPLGPFSKIRTYAEMYYLPSIECAPKVGRKCSIAFLTLGTAVQQQSVPKAVCGWPLSFSVFGQFNLDRVLSRVDLLDQREREKEMARSLLKFEVSLMTHPVPLFLFCILL